MPDSSPSAQQPTPQRLLELAAKLEPMAQWFSREDHYWIIAESAAALVAAAAAVEEAERLREALREVHEYNCGCDRPGAIGYCTAQPVVVFAALAGDGAKEEAERLREALEWYAERRNYTLPGGRTCEQHGGNACSVFHRDVYDGKGPGARARAALAGDGSASSEGATCPNCGNVRGAPDPSRFACSECWDALAPSDSARLGAEPPTPKARCPKGGTHVYPRDGSSQECLKCGGSLSDSKETATDG